MAVAAEDCLSDVGRQEYHQQGELVLTGVSPVLRRARKNGEHDGAGWLPLWEGCRNHLKDDGLVDVLGCHRIFSVSSQAEGLLGLFLALFGGQVSRSGKAIPSPALGGLTHGPMIHQLPQ
jgi:hypothetical protein